MHKTFYACICGVGIKKKLIDSVISKLTNIVSIDKSKKSNPDRRAECEYESDNVRMGKVYIYEMFQASHSGSASSSSGSLDNRLP